MALGTIASRITGILRDITMVTALGLALLSDAFSLGNTLPNIIYLLLIGGALNAIFIPQIVRHFENDADKGKRFIDQLLSATIAVLFIVTLLAVLFAPTLIGVFAPTDMSEAQFELAVAFARFCLPQVFFYGLFTMVQQVLNARNRFTLSFFAPVLNNIIAITVFVSFIVVSSPLAVSSLELPAEHIALLGLGSTFGVALQALILLPALSQIGYRFSFNFAWKETDLGKTLQLAKWTIALIAVNQIAYIVVTRFVTSANIEAVLTNSTAAGLTTYQKANLIYILPHSVITISLITALLPRLSASANQKDEKGFGDLVSYSLRMILVLIVPVALFLFISAEELSVFLFGYGAAGVDAAAKVGQVTALFALGLPAFSLIYVINRIWYSTENTRTPFVFSILINALAVGLGVALFNQASVQDKVGMFGLSYSIAYWCCLLAAFWWLTRSVRNIDIAAIVMLMGKVILASVIAAGAMWWVISTYSASFAGNSKLVFVLLTLVWLLCTCIYVALAMLLQVKELRDVSSILRKRFKTSA